MYYTGMKRVAKVLICNGENQYLLTFRGNHPTFGNDPDLPGGTQEPGEDPKATAIREVMGETGIELDEASVTLRIKDTTTSKHSTEYYVYETQLAAVPKVTLSWEHALYKWVNRDELIAVGRGAKDTFMQVVAKTLEER